MIWYSLQYTQQQKQHELWCGIPSRQTWVKSMIHGLFLLEYTQKEQIHNETCLNCYPLHTREQTAWYMVCFYARGTSTLWDMSSCPLLHNASSQLVCNGILMDLDVLLSAQGHPKTTRLFLLVNPLSSQIYQINPNTNSMTHSLFLHQHTHSFRFSTHCTERNTACYTICYLIISIVYQLRYRVNWSASSAFSTSDVCRVGWDFTHRQANLFDPSHARLVWVMSKVSTNVVEGAVGSSGK